MIVFQLKITKVKPVKMKMTPGIQGLLEPLQVRILKLYKSGVAGKINVKTDRYIDKTVSCMDIKQYDPTNHHQSTPGHI